MAAVMCQHCDQAEGFTGLSHWSGEIMTNKIQQSVLNSRSRFSFELTSFWLTCCLLFKYSDTTLRQWRQCPSVFCTHTAYANPVSCTEACLVGWEHQGEKQGYIRAATLKWWNLWNQRPLWAAQNCPTNFLFQEFLMRHDCKIQFPIFGMSIQ